MLTSVISPLCMTLLNLLILPKQNIPQEGDIILLMLLSKKYLFILEDLEELKIRLLKEGGSGLDEIIDVHLILTVGNERNKTDAPGVWKLMLGNLNLIKFNPSSLILVENEQEIREYFAQNGEHYFNQLPLEGRGWLDEKEEIEKQLNRTLKDYQRLQNVDLSKDIPEARYLFLSRESAERKAENNNECSRMLRAIDNEFRRSSEESRRRYGPNGPRIGARI